MANDFSGDSNCVALYNCEKNFLGVDSQGGNDLTEWNTPSFNNADYCQGDESVDMELSSEECMYIDDADLDSGYPHKNGDSTKIISLCAFVMFESLPGAWDSSVIYYKGNESENKRVFMIRLYNNDGTYQWEIGIGYNSGANWETVTITTGAATGRWYHIGITHDDSDKSWYGKVWDFAAAGTPTRTGGSQLGENSGTFSNNINIETSRITWGCNQNLATDYPSSWWHDGETDEGVVFKDILSEAEIDQIRQGTYGAAAGLDIPIAMHHYKMLRN